MTYRSIVSSPEFHACAYQMAQASFTEASIIEAITREQDFREYTTEQIEQITEGIKSVVARNF